MGYTKSGLKYNHRERAVQEDCIRSGWKVLYKGWPDFLFYKEENGKIQAFFMEVKRKPYHNGRGAFTQRKTFDVRLSPEQEEMHRVLKLLGLDVKLIQKE